MISCSYFLLVPKNCPLASKCFCYKMRYLKRPVRSLVTSLVRTPSFPSECFSNYVILKNVILSEQLKFDHSFFKLLASLIFVLRCVADKTSKPCKDVSFDVKGLSRLCIIGELELMASCSVGNMGWILIRHQFY